MRHHKLGCMGLFLLLLAACTRHGHVPIQDRWQPDEGGLPEELLDAKLLAVGEPTHASPTTKTAWAAVLREWAAGAGDERESSSWKDQREYRVVGMRSIWRARLIRDWRG